MPEVDGEYQQQTTVVRGPEALWGRQKNYISGTCRIIADAQLENNTYLHEGSEC